MIDFNAIYGALYARLDVLTAFVTRSRRLRGWYDVGAEEQPSLFMAQGDAQVRPETGKPTKWMLKASIYIYTKVPDDAAPGPYLNDLIALVLQALKADDPFEDRCTLGGLVHYARISGIIETDEGTLGDQAVAVVPVEILVTD